MKIGDSSILVTGGAGYIGSHAVLALRDAGYQVVVIDNLTTGFAWAVPEDVPLVRGDIADQNLVEQTLRKHRVRAIMHFAGSVVVPESVSDPLKYYGNNSAKTRDRDCQDFRVWPGIMGNKESHYVTTQRTCHTE